MVGSSLVQSQVMLVLKHQEAVLPNCLLQSLQCPVLRLVPPSLQVVVRAPRVEDRHQVQTAPRPHNPVQRLVTRQCRYPRKGLGRRERAGSSLCRRVQREAAGRVLA